jgi:hypothetical protein
LERKIKVVNDKVIVVEGKKGKVHPISGHEGPEDD